MRRATKRRLRLFGQLVLVGSLIGAGYGAVIGVIFRGHVTPRMLVSAIDGTAIALVVASVEIFFLRTRWGRPLQRAPFVVTFGVKWIVYGVVILAVTTRSPGVALLGSLGGLPNQPPVARLGIVFAFVAVFAVVFVYEIAQIVGRRNLSDIILGRYHRPRFEERFFLFVDVAGSTALAERLGPAAVHRFLAAVFSLAAEPIADCGGEIYQYVGDEMVVTWRVSGTAGPPIACFFAIVAALKEAAPAFERDFGATPQVRAALHAGPVIVGEVGESKRDIVFHGDVMNTAARLEHATRELDRRFLVSAEALDRLPTTDHYVLEPLGRRTLRGRAAPVEVYAVEALDTAGWRP